MTHTTARDGWRKHTILWVASAALILLSAAYLGRGLGLLVFQRQPAIDLHMRWMELRYVYHGQNPYDVVAFVHAKMFDLPLPECTRDNHTYPEVGTPYHRSGGYPPWAFPTIMPFVLPTPWQFTAAYFAFVDVLALFIAFVWAYQIGRPHSRAGGVFLGAAAIALFANYRALQVGQYGIIVNALLIGAYWLVQAHRPVASGVLFGMALLKPQISGLFALSFLVRRQWRALAAATAYVVLASCVTWAMTRTNPIEMLGQMYALAQGWIDHPDPRIKEQHPIGVSSLTSILLGLGVDRKVSTPLAGIMGLFLCGVLMSLWRKSSTLTLFAIAATVGRVWSYHLFYDDIMLIFLIVALGKLVLTHRSNTTAFAFTLVGLSLWAPLPKNYPVPMQIAQIGIWFLGLATVLACEPRSGQADDQFNENEKTLSSDTSQRLAGSQFAAQPSHAL